MAKKVTSEEFYKAIGELVVTVTPKGNYPYCTDFCLRNGNRIGYIQDIAVNGVMVGEEYYLET